MMNDKSSKILPNPDLISEDIPADLVPLSHDLQAIYGAPKLPEKLTTFTMPRQRVRRARSYHHRLGVIAASLVAIVLATGAGYAMIPVLEQAFGMNAETSEIISEDLGQDVAIAQSIDGFTMTVRRVFADTSRIVIGYTIDGPPNSGLAHILPWGTYDNSSEFKLARPPMLTDAQGNRLDGGFAQMAPGMSDDVAAGVLIYDRPQTDQEVAALSVQLTVNTLSSFDSASDDGDSEIVIDGPWVFDLTIPVELDEE